VKHKSFAERLAGNPETANTVLPQLFAEYETENNAVWQVEVLIETLSKYIKFANLNDNEELFDMVLTALRALVTFDEQLFAYMSAGWDEYDAEDDEELGLTAHRRRWAEAKKEWAQANA
jgi:hypothetical protein